MVAALLLTSVMPLAAKPDNANKPINCDLDIAVVAPPPIPMWFGSVTNCELGGSVLQVVTGAEFPGKTEHWVGFELILPAGGGVIVIEEKGVFTFSNNKYTTNGTVVETLTIDGFPPFETSPQYDYLVGAKTHGKGLVTTAFPPVNPTDPVLATQTLRLH
jgi:hypothetical protein